MPSGEADNQQLASACLVTKTIVPWEQLMAEERIKVQERNERRQALVQRLQRHKGSNCGDDAEEPSERLDAAWNMNLFIESCGLKARPAVASARTPVRPTTVPPSHKRPSTWPVRLLCRATPAVLTCGTLSVLVHRTC